MDYVCINMLLSVVIITFNEESNISRCLESVRDVADEIVVVDSGSSDNTKVICDQFGAKFFVRAFQSYGLQKDFAVRMALYDHILSLDADEALSEELTGSIKRVKTHWNKDGYAFNRVTNFCGRWIMHGEWYPDKVLRLFDRRKVQWKGNIHEKVLPDNPKQIDSLRGVLLHYSYRSPAHFQEKTEHYATMEAAELFQKQVHPRMFHFYVKPVYRFFNAYVLRRGFMDGNVGFSIAKMTANRLHLRFDKLKRMYEQKGNPPANI
ncbi:MAG: glycosyltransferase family 2 protein [Chitinophagaceae bacterium]